MGDVQLRQIPHRGPINSRDINLFMDDVKRELNRLTELVAETESTLNRRRQDDALSRPAGANGNSQRRFEEDVALAAELTNLLTSGGTQRQVFSFFDTQHVHYLVEDGLGGDEDYPVSNRCPIDTTFGEAILPYNGIKSMFWSANGDDQTESLFLPAVEATYTETSAVAADKIEASPIRNAVDGSSLDPYLIRAVYDLDTDVEEVSFDVIVQVPQSIVRQANVLTVELAPELRCAIEGIEYSPTSITPNTTLPGLPTINKNNPVYDSKPIRFYFNTVYITSIKLTLTSKHWIVENGRKVFYVGLRELGLFLVDWDQTWTAPAGAVFTNNGFFLKLALPQVAGITPSVVYFDEVDIRTSPALSTTQTVGQGTATGIRVRLFEDDTLNVVAADSVGGGFPHTVVADRQHIWLAVELDLNNTSSAVPALKTLIAEYTVRT